MYTEPGGEPVIRIQEGYKKIFRFRGALFKRSRFPQRKHERKSALNRDGVERRGIKKRRRCLEIPNLYRSARAQRLRDFGLDSNPRPWGELSWASGFPRLALQPKYGGIGLGGVSPILPQPGIEYG